MRFESTYTWGEHKENIRNPKISFHNDKFTLFFKMLTDDRQNP